MPDTTPILSLPLILPAQAQKHVTHNEAIAALDVIVQLAVLTRNLTVPPALPSLGDRHIVPAGATGDWAGQAGRIAARVTGAWTFVEPMSGWQAQVLSEGLAVVYDGSMWKAPADLPLSVQRLGIAAVADATNRLSVSAPAVLLNHAGAGHQVKVNKATATDTASLLFQTGFSGRAEMGTAGSDAFSLKVSDDGATFRTALSADGASGEVTLSAPLHLGGQPSDPATPGDGTIWLNTTSGEVKVRSAGVTQTVGSGGGLADGDKGDITVSAAGASWTIDAGAVTLAKMADLATDSFLGRDSAGTGVPEVLSAAQARGILNIADGATANATDAALRDRATHTGTQVAGTISDFSEAVDDRVAGLLIAGSNVTLTYNDGANTLTLAAAATDLGYTASTRLLASSTGADVTLPLVGADAGLMSGADKTKLDGIAAGAQVNVPTDLTYTAGTRLLASSTGTDATLPLVTSGDAGLAPASGGGTTNFLRADGTWAAPAGGGGGSGDVVGPASAVDNALVRFDGTTGKLVQSSGILALDSNELTLPLVATPAIPAADTLNIFARKVGGRMLPAIVGPSGLDTTLQPYLGGNRIGRWSASGNNGTDTADGIAVTAMGTSTSVVWASTNFRTQMRWREWLVTTAATNAVAGLRTNAAMFSLGGNAARRGGFSFAMVWSPATGVTNASHRSFVGMRDTASAPTDVNPSALLNLVGVGYDAADTNMQFMHNDGSGTATKINLGASFPKPNTDRASVYRLRMFAPPGTAQSLGWEVTDLVNDVTTSGTVTTDIPGTATALAMNSFIGVGGVSSVVGMAVSFFYIETDN